MNGRGADFVPDGGMAGSGVDGSVTVDVDIGGTFTDCFVRDDDRIATAKAETTEYDLSVGFLEAVERAADTLGRSRSDLLSAARTVRYSTTVALNTLIEREGTRLGLLLTAGAEETIHLGRASQWADGLPVSEQRNIARAEKPSPLIPPDRTMGIDERIGAEGDVIRPLDEADVRAKVNRLIDAGVRAFAVCLLWSYKNPVHEHRVRDIIAEEYPDAYLGSAPVFLSAEVSQKRGEYERAMTTVLNAYLHRSMADELYGVGDELRAEGYTEPLMMIHNTGGTAEVFRTAAIDTFNGGPVAALIGSGYLGERYGFDNVVAADMGGTSFDLSMRLGGSTRSYDLDPVIDRWRVNATMLESKSIGAGGGSIARVNEQLDDRIEVGPQSAGANPGPACYNQGGRRPTVTDADVVLGYLNPDNFHGGAKQLDARRAERAIRREIAGPLDLEVAEAASLIRRIVDADMGNTIYKETALRGHDPRDFLIFAFGGAGPTHACSFARHADIDTVVTFPYAPVFSAFGASVMDPLHIYEQSASIPVIHPDTLEPFDDYDAFNDIVSELQREALRDFRGEGYEPSAVTFELELDMKYGGQLDITRVASPRLEVAGADDIRAIVDAFESEYEDAYSPISTMPETGIDVENFVLKGRDEVEPPALPSHPGDGPDPSAAKVGQREVYWPRPDGFRPTPIYERAALRPENELTGPAIIESTATTTAVPPDATFRIDEHLTGHLQLDP